MLPSTPQVESVYLDPKSGILAGIPDYCTPLAPESSHLSFEPEENEETNEQAATLGRNDPHTLLIDGTTLDPTAAIRIAETVHRQTDGGAVMLDAPVSGGKSGISTSNPRLHNDRRLLLHYRI